jgi:cytochrome P450
MATEDRERLRDELLSLLLAGRDTTASLVGSLLFALAKDPQAWHKVREEIKKVLNGEIPSYEKLRDLKYAKYCLNESKGIVPFWIFAVNIHDSASTVSSHSHKCQNGDA